MLNNISLRKSKRANPRVISRMLAFPNEGSKTLLMEGESADHRRASSSESVLHFSSLEERARKFIRMKIMYALRLLEEAQGMEMGTYSVPQENQMDDFVEMRLTDVAHQDGNPTVNIIAHCPLKPIQYTEEYSELLSFALTTSTAFRT